MKIIEHALVVPSGGSLSNGKKIDGRVCNIIVPTIDSAAISFQLSHDGVTWFDLFNGATEISIAASTGNKAQANPAGFTNGTGWLKIRTGLTGAGVNQAANRTFYVLATYGE